MGSPEGHFSRVPPREQAAELATRVRSEYLGPGREEEPILHLADLCRRLDVRPRSARLLPERGGSQALLIPLPNDRFEAAVDPTPASGWGGLSPELREELHRHRFRFLLAHELGHSFFFRRGCDAPARALLTSADEEGFCDEFARWLLVSRDVATKTAIDASAVFQLHRRFDVSVQVAARAVAEASSYSPWVMLLRTDETEPANWRVQWASSGAPRFSAAILRGPVVRRALGQDRPEPNRRAEASKLDAEFSASRGQLVLIGH